MFSLSRTLYYKRFFIFNYLKDSTSPQLQSNTLTQPIIVQFNQTPKPCICKSITHKKTSHRLCPLNVKSPLHQQIKSRLNAKQSSGLSLMEAFNSLTEEEPTILIPSNINKCRCGSDTHSRTNFSLCPLNKKNVGQLTEKEILEYEEAHLANKNVICSNKKFFEVAKKVCLSY